MKAVVVSIDVSPKGVIQFGVSDVTELMPPTAEVAECETEIAKAVCGHLKFQMRRIMEAAEKDLTVKGLVVEGQPVEGADAPERSMFAEDPLTEKDSQAT